MIIVKINNVDKTNQIKQASLVVNQKLTNQVDTALFTVINAGSKTLVPVYGDDVTIYNGTEKIFGGTILEVDQLPLTGVDGIEYRVKCVDYAYEMDRLLASRTYEDETIEDIITDLIDTYAVDFTYNNVSSTFLIEKIVFNQVSLTSCLKKLADIVQYDWYIDADKDIHFFSKYTNDAPFELQDTNGNYIYKTLKRTQDGSQVVNRVKVRGGEYNGDTYTDDITVSGNDTKSFKLPYKFANLTVDLDTGGGFVSKNVGIDFIDDFTTDDVLYNFQEQTIFFENALSDGDIIRFSGNPKIPVFVVSEDPDSIASYGKIEKLIEDNSIESNDVARRRANAELYAYALPIIDANFKTYESGLRTGMIIKVQSDIRGLDENLIINQIKFKMRDHESFQYDVSLISTKRFELITLLQKILEPDVQKNEEVSEEIFTDTQNITIEEEIEMTIAVEDVDQEIESEENYIIDPFGTGVNATYVLAEYNPTSQTDPKRNGRLDISFVVY